MMSTFEIIDWNKWFFRELEKYDCARLPLTLWGIKECRDCLKIEAKGNVVIPKSIKLFMKPELDVDGVLFISHNDQLQEGAWTGVGYDCERLGSCELYRQMVFKHIMASIGNQWIGQTIGIHSFAFIPQVLVASNKVVCMVIVRVFPISDVVSKYGDASNDTSANGNNQIAPCAHVQYPATTWHMGINYYELPTHESQQVWIQTKEDSLYGVRVYPARFFGRCERPYFIVETNNKIDLDEVECWCWNKEPYSCGYVPEQQSR